jgi:sugar lactone lactonase YvrE
MIGTVASTWRATPITLARGRSYAITQVAKVAPFATANEGTVRKKCRTADDFFPMDQDGGRHLKAPRILSTPKCVWPAGARLGEGALWSQQLSALYWVDIQGRRLYRYTPAGERRESWPFDEEISAVAERAAPPDVLVTEVLVTLKSGFAFFDTASGNLTPLHNPEPDRPGNRFNDGKCDATGRFWAGTMDAACRDSTGALYSFDASFRCTRHLDGIHISNGPTWSADGRTMYFNETGKGQVNALDFNAQAGTVSNRRVWLQFQESEGVPDGMTTDADGRIWIAHWGGSCVTCRDTEGRVLARVELPASQITSCAFGGPDLSTLYITSAKGGLSPDALAREPLAGGVFAVETDARGMPAPGFSG